ncbi:MAG: antibiotic biosynthesis monooxygenase [Steroidobacteraceae bacterium]
MILEVATFTIKPDQLAEFEKAFVEARKVITQSDGCGSVALQRSIENPGRYVLFVEWPTVAHHMEGFRNSPLFAQWRALLGPYFAAAPAVEHFDFVR